MTPPSFTYFPPERPALWPNQFAAAAGTPLLIVPRRWRQEAPVMALLFLLIFLFYAATAAETVGLEDDGLFIGNLHFFGVAHPPGYPAHTLLGGIFYHLLPGGQPAYKAHLFSAFAGAGACTALYAIVAMLLQGRLFALLAALAYACSKTFWSQAIIAEVYTLNAFLFFTLLALAMTYVSRRRPPRRLLFIMAAVAGVGLANHYPLLLAGGAGLALLVFARLPNKLVMAPAAAAASLLAALPFYLWLIWRSHQPVGMHFYGDALDTADKFWFYVLRKGYGGVDRQAGAEWSDKLIFAEHFSADLLWQFTPLAVPFILIGFLLMARSRYNWLWLCLLLSFLCSSALLLILLNFEAGFIAFAVFRVYYLLAYGIMAIWLALGAAWSIDRLRGYPTAWRRLAAAALTAALVAAAIITHWQANNRSGYTWAEDLARAKLDSIEPDAILFAHDDLDIPVIYLHSVKGERPDLTVYNDQGLILPNRLFSPLLPEYPPPHNPQSPSRIAYIHRFIADATAPIYYHSTRYGLFTTREHGSEFLGFYRRVNRDSPDSRVALHPNILAWLQKNLDGSQIIHDPWTRFQQYETISSVMNAVVQSAEEGSLALTDEWRDIIARAREKNAKTRVLTNFIRLDRLTESERRREAEWLAGFDLAREELMDKFGRGRFYLLQARLAELNDGRDDPLYESSLLQSLREDERASNPGVGWLLDYYSENRARTCDYIKMADHYYPNVSRIPAARLTQLRAVRARAQC